MTRHAWVGVLVLATVAGLGVAGEPCCASGRSCFLQRVAPASGWFSNGGGRLSWWDPYCFPRCGGPDDYCRKPLPAVCWPPYPPYFIWGPPAALPVPGGACQAPPLPR
jgi:hypothetical protein